MILSPVQLYEDISARGGEFIVTGAMVQVRGATISSEELISIFNFKDEFVRIVADSQKPSESKKEIPRTIEAVAAALSTWKAPLTRERGYLWDRSNWQTEWNQAVLDQDVKDYVSGNIDIHTLHTTFLDYADAHKTSYLVHQDGESVRTVVMQVQPTSSDFSRMLKLLNIDSERYISIIG